MILNKKLINSIKSTIEMPKSKMLQSSENHAIIRKADLKSVTNIMQSMKVCDLLNGIHKRFNTKFLWYIKPGTIPTYKLVTRDPDMDLDFEYNRTTRSTLLYCYISAYTYQELLSALPSTIIINNEWFTLKLNINAGNWHWNYYNNCNETLFCMIVSTSTIKNAVNLFIAYMEYTKSL